MMKWRMHHRNIIQEGVVQYDYGTVVQWVSDAAESFMGFINMDGKIT